MKQLDVVRGENYLQNLKITTETPRVLLQGISWLLLDKLPKLRLRITVREWFLFSPSMEMGKRQPFLGFVISRLIGTEY